jgi:aspartyl-tRNA(Asn)/glutamyl-tRNA(Gln) amidotransferase subunit A
MTDALHFRTLSSLAQGIEDGEFSSVDVTRCFIDRIESMNGELNAFRLPTPERALAAARAADRLLASGQRLGPLHGVPYAAKDLYDVQGLPTSAGARALEDNIATADSHTVASLSRAGMVLLGKTNTVQFAYGGVGVNHDHGTPVNPWGNAHHVPGGSSSGSGVAVAAGLAPMGLGTDTGGSVRIPAALCGISGLKTTVGRVPRTGVFPLSWSLDSVGPLARSVEDCAMIYEAITGQDDGDPSTQSQQPQHVRQSLDGDIRGLRVGFAQTAFWDDADAETVTRVRTTADTFSALGATVLDVEFAAAGGALALNPGGLIIAAEAYTLNRDLVDASFDELDPAVSNRVIKGKNVTAADYLGNLRAWDGLRARAVDEMRDVDVLLCPATMVPSHPLAMIDKDPDTYSAYNLQYLRNTSIGNILGLCGLSVPCGFNDAGLPIGLMIYGKPFDEITVLRAGHAYQQATDWHLHTPSFPA